VCRELIGDRCAEGDMGGTANIVGYGENEQEGQDRRRIIDGAGAGIPNTDMGRDSGGTTKPYKVGVGKSALMAVSRKEQVGDRYSPDVYLELLSMPSISLEATAPTKTLDSRSKFN
jgi:hypothetical protein